MNKKIAHIKVEKEIIENAIEEKENTVTPVVVKPIQTSQFTLFNFAV